MVTIPSSQSVDIGPCAIQATEREGMVEREAGGSKFAGDRGLRGTVLLLPFLRG